MSNFYNTGLHHGGIVIPEPARVALQRFNDAHWGYKKVREGEGRFYQSGLDRTMVGANSPGVLGTLVDTMVNLTLDIAHVLLILAGMYALWRAISPL